MYYYFLKSLIQDIDNIIFGKAFVSQGDVAAGKLDAGRKTLDLWEIVQQCWPMPKTDPADLQLGGAGKMVGQFKAKDVIGIVYPVFVGKFMVDIEKR